MKRILRSVTRTSSLILFAILVSSYGLIAQTRTITGVVKSDNEALPGVTVLEKGTNNGTVTDGEGKFTLVVSENATLSISFVGMKPQEIVVGNQTSFDIDLESDATQLSEVLVIGYGTVERRDLTSSVSALNDKELKDIPINSAAQALSGRMAGVQVTTAEGSPDADVRIRVRGGMSITGDNSPLYVVDGIQVENALSVLSPQDIESISVLKDASVTAIYGSRGANGVVIITTKGGKGGRTTVNFNALIGVKQLGNKLDVWKPYDFVKYQYDRSRGSAVNEQNFLDDYGVFEDIELYKEVPFVDWQEEVFGRNALMQTYNLSVNGGNETTSFNLSVTSNKEEGVMLGSDFDRKLINFKMDHDITSKLNIEFNMRYNNTVVNGAGTSVEGSSSLNRLRHSVKYRPFLAPGQDVNTYDPDYAQETNANSLSLINPVLLTKQEYQQRKGTTTNFNGSFSYKITDFLTWKSTLGVDFYNEQRYVFNDTITNASRLNGAGQPIATIDSDTRNTFNNSNVLSFSSSNLSSFPANHKLDVLLGQEIYQTLNKSNFQENKFFPVGITPELAFGSMELGVPQPTSNTEEYESKLLSFFSRASYSYNDKYFLTLSLRADGSSKFAPENRWGYFPAGSFMWRVSSEPFMEGLSSTFNDLKFRVSYGTSGNNRIDDYLYLSTFDPSGFYSINNTQVLGFSATELANANLKWEAIIARNIGLDASFFQGRLQTSVDFYYNSSKELLLNRVIPPTSGYPSQTQNIGETLNKGIELQLSGTILDRGNLKYDANFNISFNKNEIESLGPDQTSFLISSGWAGSNQPADFKVIVGQPVGTIWGLVTDGFYTLDDFDYESGTGVYTLKSGVASNQGITSTVPQPGVIKFKDINEDGVINDNDRKVIGVSSPKFYGGLNQTVTYKNFDLSMFINFQFGNDVLNANKLEFTSGYTVNSNLLTTMDNRWKNVDDAGQVVTDPTELAELNRNTTIWSPLTTASSFYVHSWAVEDGSFVRINNITLGYTLPSAILSKVRISKFRVYGTVNNVAVFSNYSGYDPEANTRRNTPLTPGVDYAAYPRSRGYIFGVNVTF